MYSYSTTSKIRQRLNWKFNDFLFGAGMKKFKLPKIPFQRILIYHGIDEVGETKYNSRFISETVFEKQLLFFKTHFHVVSLDDYYKENFHDKLPTIALTFDDGYANNFQRALPLLEKCKVPATFFITTIRAVGYDILWPDAIDISLRVSNASFELSGDHFSVKGKRGYISEKTNQSLKEMCKNSGFDFKSEMIKQLPGLSKALAAKNLDDYHVLLNENQIKQLSDSSFVTIGSHGYYHNCLERIPLEDAISEMKLSKDYLEKITQKEIDAFAFPDGHYSEELKQNAVRIGYKKLLASDLEKGDVETKILKARFGMNPHISLFNQMNCIAKGNYF